MTINIEAIKKQLEAKQAELQENIRGLDYAHPKPVDPVEAHDVPNDNEDQATDFLEMQQEQSLLVNEESLLTLVTEALERIKNGTYGLCVECGKPIPEKRLEAIPWANRDVEHEEQVEEINLSNEEFYESETQ